VGTKNKQQTVPILFAGGAYGTFVEWCLQYFSGAIDSELPFDTSGSSHRYRGNHLNDMPGWREYLVADTFYPIVRFHVKTLQEESFQSNLDEVISSVDQSILLYANVDLAVLQLNNRFEKVYANGWLEVHEQLFLDNLSGWGNRRLNQLARWELREFLSMYIWKQHLDETGLDTILTYNNPKLLKIDIGELFDNFESTIRHLLAYCKLPAIQSNFEEVHRAWVGAQVHKNKDRLVASIVNSVINNNIIDWSNENLTIVDESIVQMRLRDLHNLELKCYNLNEFPTSTQQLREFLIHV
jgi:hypothetical protein